MEAELLEDMDLEKNTVDKWLVRNLRWILKSVSKHRSLEIKIRWNEPREDSNVYGFGGRLRLCYYMTRRLSNYRELAEKFLVLTIASIVGGSKGRRTIYSALVVSLITLILTNVFSILIPSLIALAVLSIVIAIVAAFLVYPWRYLSLDIPDIHNIIVKARLRGEYNINVYLNLVELLFQRIATIAITCRDKSRGSINIENIGVYSYVCSKAPERVEITLNRISLSPFIKNYID